MYVWMMEHCDGVPLPWRSFFQTSPSLLQVKSRLSLAPALTTTLASGVWWPPWSPILCQIGEICRFPTSSSTSPPLSCLIFLIFPLFPTSWSSLCRSCYCTALTGFSRSPRDGCSPTGELKRPRTLSERLPGGVGSRFLPLLVIWDLNDLDWSCNVFFLEEPMVEFFQHSGGCPPLLRGAPATAVKVLQYGIQKSLSKTIVSNFYGRVSSKSRCWDLPVVADVGSATSFFRLFTMPNMRRKTFICYYLWFRFNSTWEITKTDLWSIPEKML